MEELQAGGVSNSKSFQHFKTQIDKLTKSMTQLEKDTANWRQKYEVGGILPSRRILELKYSHR